jgi:hypothetical protein
MIDGFPLSFFLPLVVHALAGLTTGVTGMLAFRAPKRRGRHHRWGKCYLWAYTLVFLTATILSVQRWEADASLFFLALTGYGFVLAGYGARRFRREPIVMRLLGNGLIVYPLLGIGAALLTVLATVVTYSEHFPTEVVLPLSLASLLSLLHTFATTRAAPVMRSLKDTPNDEAILTAKLDLFARWHAVRATFQVLAFFVQLWALVMAR